MSLVIARAPLRVELAGGWRPLPLFARAHGVATVSAAVDRYCYVVAEERADGELHVDSSDLGLSERCLHGVLVELGEPLQIAKAVMEFFGDHGLYERGVSLFLSSQARPGFGLGASSAMAVALVRALGTYLGLSMTADECAELSGWIETERLALPGGKEDHYVSARGGILTIRTHQGESSARPVLMSPEARNALAHSLLLFQLQETEARAPDSEWSDEASPTAVRALHELASLAEETVGALEASDLPAVGRLLEVSWEYRRRLAPPQQAEELDRLYEVARLAGAMGARLSGRRILLVFAQLEKLEHVRSAMAGQGLREFPFSLASEGVQLLAGGTSGPAMGGGIVTERVAPRWRQQPAVSADRDRLRSS